SPLSRAIRDLERDLGVTLFVRTTRRVALTPAAELLLERSRRALAEIDGAVADVRRHNKREVVGIGCGPFSRTVATRIAETASIELPGLCVRLEEEVTPDSLRRVRARELAAAIVMETPSAARGHRVRIDALRDEPLLAALPVSHRFAAEGQIPVGAFAAERVLLPREPPGQVFNAWLRTMFRAHGFELERTTQTMSAPWDRRMLPVATGEAVCVVVAEWTTEWGPGLVAVPFEPTLTFPTDLASSWPPTEGVEALVRAACRVRDAEAWLTQRPARSQLPGD
ncbi:MAG: LysR family transcriptional regulator, partial [Solirubrobacterales bacterium]|nr:LysR family transcriptional regulator [Solirubrobacterales bacterium]